ncbi:hypothetical protein GMO_01970 [Gluconobacter morbifer G707]|uniref:Uncharacterized protein n=1 Tax=Gluconobacter morbifer G707 TaxID=1088869 RepID=G6XFD2_9PROT|nr:hypothetical protein GMO_01970 [Gluconobacter morbifer G707]
MSGVRAAPDELDIFTAEGAQGCADLEHDALDAARPPVVQEMEQQIVNVDPQDHDVLSLR